MSEQQMKRDRLLTPFVERNLQLQGNKLPDAKYPPSFQFEFDPEGDNKIGVTVWSGVPGEDGRQAPIRCSLEAYALSCLANYAEKAPAMAEGTESRGVKVNGIRKKRPGDESKLPSKGWDATLFVGKDQQGVCYLSVMAKGHPKLKFPFKPSMWTESVNVRTGEPATPAEVSADYAEAWARIIMPIAMHLLCNHPYDWKSGRTDRNNEGASRFNNGGGFGGSKPAAKEEPSFGNDFDDDIPM